jgi:acyl-coenzyme A synthetase/AMP-(fatty) acid ligase
MKSLAELCEQTLAIAPSRAAIEFDGQWHDWGAVQALAQDVRRKLSQSGASARGAVIFVPRNRPSALAALVAMLADGRDVRMIYAFQSPAAIAAAIERLDAPAVIMAEEDFTPEVRAVLAAKGMAGIGLSETHMGEMTARVIPGLEQATPRPEPTDAPQVEILTSGTTGPPKQFPIPHSIIAGFVLNQGMTMIEDPDEPPFLMSFPIGNISGIYSVAASLLRGKRVVLLDRFSVEKWRDFVVRYRPKAGGAPPAAVAMIIDADLPAQDLSSLKFFSTGAAPLDPTVQRRFEEKYGIPILLSYGATEFGGPVVSMTPQLRAEWGDAKFGSVGRPMAGVRLRVRDPLTDEIQGPDQEGVLELVSPRMGPDWIRTSDIAVIDNDGFLFHRGRADGAIMRGGFKVLPETIERALLLHPAISAVGVVGVADPRVSQVPGAAIELKPGMAQPEVGDLEAHLRRRLPSTHIPVHWRFVETLPKNPSFKIDRPGLRRLFEDQEPG